MVKKRLTPYLHAQVWGLKKVFCVENYFFSGVMRIA